MSEENRDLLHMSTPELEREMVRSIGRVDAVARVLRNRGLASLCGHQNAAAKVAQGIAMEEAFRSSQAFCEIAMEFARESGKQE